MTKVQEKHHYYTDQERYEYCRKCKLSRKTISEFARENGLCRSTLRDWMNAYNNINGKFINGKTIKMYYEDDYGSWLLQNKLFEGKFKWPKGLCIGTKISKEQLNGLCKGLEVIESRREKTSKGIEYI